MEPPDREGHYVRHYETHRNAFVRELGLQKMVVDCPNTNIMEHRWKTAFHEVPGSLVSVTSYRVDGKDQLCATTEENGISTAEDAYYCEGEVLSLAAPSGLPIDYAVTWDGYLVDLNRTSVSYRIQEDHVIVRQCAHLRCAVVGTGHASYRRLKLEEWETYYMRAKVPEWDKEDLRAMDVAVNCVGRESPLEHGRYIGELSVRDAYL